MLLCVTKLEGVGAVPILRKNSNLFPLFLFINTLCQMIKLRFLYTPPSPFYYSPLPVQSLINHIFSWKSKSSIRMQILRAFFQDAKSSLKKHKNCFWKNLMGPVKHLSQRFIEKMLTTYSRKQFPQKIPHQKFERVLNNADSYFDESYYPNY